MTAHGHPDTAALPPALAAALATALQELRDNAAGVAAPSTEKDEHAGFLIREFLDERGWSARDLEKQITLAARAARAAGDVGPARLTASRQSIDRALDGHVPTARVKAAIATAMGVPPWKVWGAGQMPRAYQREQILLAARA